MTKTLTRTLTLAALITAVGCGDNPRGDDEVGNDAPDTGVTADADADATAEAGSESAGGESASDSTVGDSTAGEGDSTGDSTGDGDSGPGTKFDLGVVPDTGFMNCQGGGNGNPDFSYLWAANSEQGTISKIDTATVTEVGRYIVRPDSAGSPSRTSVSLSGHVAVANRSGGVTKIYANSDLCQESNGTPGIQTSNSAAFLPWGEEECIAWYHPFGYASQRPVAWGQGVFNQGTCQYDDEELWTSGNNQGGSLDIIVLDGDDGSIKEMIAVPTGGNNLNSDFYGIYGGAVDGDGNFWGSQLGSTGKLLKVTRSDMSYEVIQPPQVGAHWYGMTVDSDGMVWLCSDTAARYDPMTQSWANAQVGGSSGCMADASENGLLWMAAWNQVVGVDRETLQVAKTCPVEAYGISIDFEGYVWGVAFGSAANKIDPETCQVWTYNGLVGAYTYSDMTGYALSNVGTPSG
ncbi:hypothetical protein ACNOYE_03495 [Nannocystaceae bacterium ST9]